MKLLLALCLVSQSVWAGAPTWATAITESVRSHFPKGSRIEVENVRINLQVAKRFRVWGFSPELPLGLIGFQAEVEEGGKVSRAAGTATVRVFLPVAIAKSPIAQGEGLSGDNTQWEEREISRLIRGGYFTDKAALSGRSAKTYIGVGQTIGHSNSQLPFDVAAGQTVDLTRQKGNLVLTAKVRAMQNGRKDQWVQVQNPTTGKILVARVTGSGEVQVQ